MKKIIINYKNTGIQTLRGTAYFILVVGLIAALITFINSFVSTGRFSDDFVFLWTEFVKTLLILIATFFCYGICVLLAYLGENAFIARKQREELLAKKGIELEFLDHEKTIGIKDKKTGWISRVTLSAFEQMKAEHGEENYEILEENV